MQFGPVPLTDARDTILAHNIAGPDGKRILRKGTCLSTEDIARLQAIGYTEVYAARLEEGDVDEDTAARTVAEAIGGAGLTMSRAAVGRVNLSAESLGVLRINHALLDAIHELDGITAATLPSGSVVSPRTNVATIKIIPFAVPTASVQTVTDLTAEHSPILHLDVLAAKQVGLVLSGSPAIRERLEADFEALAERVTELGSQVVMRDFVALGAGQAVEQNWADAIARQRDAGVSLIILAGETAIMDRNDMVPRAIESAGGQVEIVGAPVEPGNLLMLAYLDDIPVLGAPGCARSRKPNIVDQVLPRLLVGEHLTRKDILSLAHGGLLK